MPVMKLESREIFYDKQAAPKPQGTIFFVHGSGGSAKVWRNQIKDLSTDWDCVSIDLPGHGASPPPACSSVREAASLLNIFMDTESWQQPFYMAGHSLGAAVTLYYARYYSGYLDGFVLLGGGAKMKVLPQVLESLSRGQIYPEFARMSFSDHSDPALVETEVNVYMQNSSAVLFQDLNACNEFDMINELSNIHLPALLITGRDDLLTPVKYAEFLHKNLNHAALEIIESAGHFAMLEKPCAVSLAMADFINNL